MRRRSSVHAQENEACGTPEAVVKLSRGTGSVATPEGCKQQLRIEVPTSKSKEGFTRISSAALAARSGGVYLT
jgi:hypothetical protein